MSKCTLNKMSSITVIVTVAAAIGMVPVFFGSSENTATAENSLETDFLVLNLNGEPDSKFLPYAWHIIENEVLQVNIVNSFEHSKLSIIEDVIFDKKTIEYKDQTSKNTVYYTGWKGALDNAAKNETYLYIPQEFEIIQNSENADISIILTDDVHEDELSGTTKLLLDKNQNQIIQAEITIYEVDSITDKEFAAIMRHEFGHALGLGHSNDKDNIMYYQIQTNNEYISDCTVYDIVLLHGGKTIQTTCQD